MERKIIFLGAGASIPFYNPRLSTKYITDAIKDKDKWSEIVSRYTSLMGPSNIIQVDAVVETIESICKLFPNVNFEQIIEFLDKLTSYSFDPTSDTTTFHILLRFFKVHYPSIGFHTWDNVPFLVRQLISEVILDLQTNHKSSDYDTYIQLFQDFLKNVSKDSELNIVTLNYDDTIYQATHGLGFKDGFINGRFDFKEYIGANKVLSFPHGHIRFTLDGEGILYNPNSLEASYLRLKNIASHSREKTEYLISSSFAYNFNTFIATGQQKDSTFDINPYAAYFQKFAHDGLVSDTVYIIGYSFSDPHFNRMLLNFLSIKQTNKIIIVDYLDRDIDLMNEMSDGSGMIDTDNFIYRLWRYLKDTSPLSFSGDKYEFQSGVDNLNSTGFGEIFERIFLYKKGFDSFLQEYNALVH